MKDIKLHIVLVTKYRYKIINKNIENYIYVIMRKKEVKYNYKILQMKVGSKNHLHLVVKYKGVLSIDNFISLLKRTLSYNVRNKFTYLKKRKSFWNNSFFVSSVSNMSKEVVLNYVYNQ